jgi:phytoene synthase
VPELSHCALLVRGQAPDRYLATLFAPAAAREALFALYAFEHEIGKVRHVVSEPMAGLIRLQWWRDTLAAAQPPAHPVAQALHEALAAAPPVRARLEAAIDGREHELEGTSPADLAALEQHLEETSGSITLAALEVLDAADAGAVAAKIGLTIGLAETLRRLPEDVGRGRSLLPRAELVRHGLDPGTVGEADARLDPVIVRLAARGIEHLRAARAGRRAVPRPALPALLPGTLAGAWLERLGRARHDLLARIPRQRRSPLAPLTLLWRYAAGRF